MWPPLPPAAYTSMVGTRHRVKKGSQLSVPLREGHTWLPCHCCRNSKLTSGIHLRPGWEQGAREGNVFLLGHSSVPGCHSGEDRSGSGRQYPCYLPGTPIPEVQGLLQYEALSCTYIVRSKVTVKAAAGKRCSPGLWKLLFNFLSSFKLGSHLPPPHP